MCAAEMICHLREAFRLALTERTAAPIPARIPPPLMKFLALRLPMRWPRNVETVPELKIGAAAPPTAFADDYAGLLATFEAFCAATGNRTRHPIFGKMTPSDWLRWGYLHTDHHLRQFGR